MSNEGWTRNEINYVVMHPDKIADHRFLKDLAASLDDEDVAEGVDTLVIDGDPVGIDLVTSLMLCLYHLRTEFIAWETEERRPGLSRKHYARIALKESVANLPDADTAMKLIDYVRGGIEDGAMDFILGLIDAVHELRDELSAWAELSAAEAVVQQ
jgi:hypothetical protein